jgi:hydrogenase nickel incorporation protein HypA/HybF
VHEVSLAQSLLDIVQEYAEQHGFAGVNTLRVSCGRLSCVAPDALKFAFDLQAEGTCAEGSEIIFDLLPARVYCFECGLEYEVESFTAECPQCRSSEVVMVGGTEELQLVEMDVNTPQE